MLGVVYWIIGVNELTPLVMNVVTGILLLYSIYWILRERGISAYGVLIVGMMVIFFMPMVAIVYGGMEHMMHSLVAVMVLLAYSRVVERGDRKWEIMLVILVMILPMVRFEGYFMVGGLVLVMMVQGRWRYGVLLMLMSLMPLVIHLIVSVSNEGFWLPNSVLIRSEQAEIADFDNQNAFVVNNMNTLKNIKKNFQYNSVVLHYLLIYPVVSMLGVLFAFFKRKTSKSISADIGILIIYLITIIIHLLIAKVGFFYRYDAYLHMLTVVAVVILIKLFNDTLKETTLTSFTRGMFIIFCVAILCMPIGFFVKRGVYSFQKTWMASKNIYEQQYQMGKFLGQNYNTATVVANDIGAITYFSDIRLLDIVGLANAEILREMIHNNYSTATLDSIAIAKNTDIAIVYDSWLYTDYLYGAPIRWIKVAEWQISDNVVCGDNKVSFYALKSETKEELIKNLMDYEKRLPQGVQVRYYNYQ